MRKLYSKTKSTDAIPQLFMIGHNRTVDVDPLSAIFPGHVAPVVRKADDGDR